MKWQNRPDRSGWWWVYFRQAEHTHPVPCEVWVGKLMGDQTVLARLFGVEWRDLTKGADALWLPMAVPEAPSERTAAPDGE